MSLKILKTEMRRRSTRVNGHFYVFKCTRDVISGFVLDSPPSSLYIWTFVLPTFDSHDFLHMSLGTRILSLSRSDVNVGRVMDVVDTTWSKLSKLQTATDLLEMLEPFHDDSTYHNWVYFLTLCRVGNLQKAKSIAIASAYEFEATFRDRYDKLKNALDLDDEQSIGDNLDNWEAITHNQFC